MPNSSLLHTSIFHFLLWASFDVRRLVTMSNKLQPLVRWRGCVHDMYVPTSLVETRSSSPRAPAEVAAVGHESIFCETCSASSLGGIWADVLIQGGGISAK